MTPPSDTAELRCERLAASYGSRTVLDDVNLVVPAGRLTAILGASGSGKTTLLRVIVGFARADQGTVTVGGRLVTSGGRSHVPPHRRGVGYVAQEGALYPHLSVGQNVGFGLSRAERKRSTRITEALELVGLDDGYARRRADELSGGEQRRVSLARALAPGPRLVLLDEPFSGLDASLRVETRRAVLNALDAAGTTAVLVTHDQAEALSMGHEVAVLRDGRLVQTASPVDLYRTPVDTEVARFVGEAVILPGHACAGNATCALGTRPIIGEKIEGPIYVMIRPEQIVLLRTLPAESTSLGLGPTTAVVTDSTYYGSETTVRLSLGASSDPVIAKCYSPEGPKPGEVVELGITGPVVAYPRG
jgi:iron(III) transport system ATP-binding protein